MYQHIKTIMNSNIPEAMTDSIPMIKGFVESLKQPNTLAYAFWLSVGLLVLISLLKYFISKDCDKKDWGNFILEFPIDVCLVVITIIITGFMKEANLSFGIILVVASLIVSIFCCILRRASIKHSYEENIKYKPLFYGLLDVLLASFWIYIVYSQII